jgi:hypothetical protein
MLRHLPVNFQRIILLNIIVILINLTSPPTIDAAPAITNINSNQSAYTNSQIPKYEKYELTFTISGTTATNFFYPYDPSPPAGLPANAGITVNAQFLSPGESNWVNAYTTPAFYYQDFDYQVKNNSDWFYPNGNFYWKARFAPNKTGTWQYRITAQDSGGVTTSPTHSFNVNESGNKGFVRVSQRDTRYFEYEDGTYFPGLGVNMNFSQIDWVNPVVKNQPLFTTLKQKGIELTRIWQSQWAIYGSFWNPWKYTGDFHDYTWLTQNDKYSGSDFSMIINKGLTGGQNPCMSFGGWTTYLPAAKPNTTYRLRARVKTTQMGTAVNTGAPFGLVFKTGGWLDNCGNSGVGTVNSTHLSTNSDWTTISGTFTTSSTQNFLPYIYLVLDNINNGRAYVDYVWVEENLGNNQFGPNLISKPSMDHLKYVDQRNSFAFDKMLELAHQNNLYLRVVSLEKNDVEANMTNFDGTTSSNEQNNANFYGNYGAPTKIYWLQQAWWRYQQARWGYSPNIHSWELLNEGDPGNGNHWKLADEMAKFFKCRAFNVSIASGDSVKCTNNHPNAHLVSTSFWSQFPTQFWNSTQWPNVDHADVHAYISTTYADNATKDLMKYDAAYYHQWHSNDLKSRNINKPIIRGEAGLDGNTEQNDTILGINRDTQHIWLHNYLWSQLFHGGMYEQYWWWQEHMRVNGVFDPNNRFGKYYAFIKDIPLSNGNYKNAEALAGNSQLRAWGQKDLVNNRAHLWIQNSKHTWKNVVDGVSIAPISAEVTVSGFPSDRSLKVEWWNTYTGTISQTTNMTTNASGQLVLPVTNLSTDIAVKIGDYTTSVSPTPMPTSGSTATSSPTPTPIPLPGDINNDRVVNLQDYILLSNKFGTTDIPTDINRDGIVNLQDYVLLSNNFGKTQ